MNAGEIARTMGGKKNGLNFMVRCPAHDDRTPSCSIRDGEDGRLLVRCFAGCDGAAVLLAFRAQGFFDDEGAGRESPRPRPVTRSPAPTSLRWSMRADEIWRQGRPIIGTLAQTYLESRGCIVPADADLRYLPADHRHEWPTMVARITDLLTGEPMSLHFTRLARDGQGKADVDPPRLMLKGHAKAGGVVRLTHDDDVTTALGLGEGLETCLSVASSGWRPIWSAIDAPNLGGLPVIDGIETLTIFADNDPAGLKEAATLQARWRDAGWEARIVAAPEEGTDWNDKQVGAAA